MEIHRDKKQNIIHAITDKEGNFMTELKPASKGSNIVQCFFDGTRLLSSSESKEYEIQV